MRVWNVQWEALDEARSLFPRKALVGERCLERRLPKSSELDWRQRFLPKIQRAPPHTWRNYRKKVPPQGFWMQVQHKIGLDFNPRNFPPRKHDSAPPRKHNSAPRNQLKSDKHSFLDFHIFCVLVFLDFIFCCMFCPFAHSLHLFSLFFIYSASDLRGKQSLKKKTQFLFILWISTTLLFQPSFISSYAFLHLRTPPVTFFKINFKDCKLQLWCRHESALMSPRALSLKILKIPLHPCFFSLSPKCTTTAYWWRCIFTILPS